MVFVALSNFNDYFLLYLVCLFVCKQIQMFAYCCKKQGPKCVTPVVQKIEQLRSLSKFIGFSRSVEKNLSSTSAILINVMEWPSYPSFW